MPAGRDGNDEAAMDARLLAHRLAQWEGRVCACEHLQPDHWDAGVGKCGVADCGCTAYDEDTFGADLIRVQRQHPQGRPSRRQRDQAMRDAFRQLGGDPGDLPA
jgi:hypothetical protein